MIAPLWTAEELLSATQGVTKGLVPPIFGISIDTRTLQPGDLFVALQGEARDGHDFVRDALAKGASAALVADARFDQFQDIDALIAVPNVLEALTLLGQTARSRLPSDSKIIAVTGSVGKTSTKEALRAILSRQGKAHASVASYNNHFGVPLTLARMPADTRYGVFEVGMNHAGEITPLSQMIRPDVALITTVEAVHLEFFSTIKEIALAKAEIFSGLKPNGVAILNQDNAYVSVLREQAVQSQIQTILTFGSQSSADIALVAVEADARGSDVKVKLFGRDLSYRLGMPGQHSVLNSLGVLASVVALGADVDAAAHALADLTPPSCRGAQSRFALDGGTITVLDESYNANPASMRAALSILALTPVGPGGRRIAVLGDMLELGQQSDQFHGELDLPVSQAGVDRVFLCGHHMKTLWNRLPDGIHGAYALQSKDLVDPLFGFIRPGDVVMIKGSLGSRMGLLVSAFSQAFKKETSLA